MKTKLIFFSICIFCFFCHPSFAGDRITQDASYYLNRGDRLHDSGKIKEAHQEYLKSLRLLHTKKEKIRAFGSLTITFSEIEDYDNAKIYCKKLLQIAPQSIWAQDQLSIIQSKYINKNTTSETADQRYGSSAYLAAAEQGDPTAQFRMGQSYYWGTGVTQSYINAGKWFLKASNQGHAEAQYYLASLYSHGLWGKTDYIKAAKWYRKAALQGNADAQNNLGTLYYNGTLGSRNYTEAARWFKKAADQGHAKAKQNMVLLQTAKKAVKTREKTEFNPTEFGKALGALLRIAVDMNRNSTQNHSYSTNSGRDDQNTDYNECRESAFQNKRVVSCQIIGGIGRPSISCKMRGSVLFSNKVSGCVNSLQNEYCDQSLYNNWCDSGVYYCDTKTFFVDDDPDNVISRICN